VSGQAFAENFDRCRTASRVRRGVLVLSAVSPTTSPDVASPTSTSTLGTSLPLNEPAPSFEASGFVPAIPSLNRQPYQVLRRRRRVLAGLVRRSVPVAAFLLGRSLAIAVRADALIHGPCLVARPVGSEWRTRRPFHRVHPNNYKGDQT
jgi:hypothetical protein